MQTRFVHVGCISMMLLGGALMGCSVSADEASVGFENGGSVTPQGDPELGGGGLDDENPWSGGVNAGNPVPNSPTSGLSAFYATSTSGNMGTVIEWCTYVGGTCSSNVYSPLAPQTGWGCVPQGMKPTPGQFLAVVGSVTRSSRGVLTCTY